MSKLWKSILAKFEEIGNQSGCHQIPERCLTIKGYQFPICARCTGVVIGEVVFFLLLFFRITTKPWIAITFLFIMFLDWLIQFIKLLESTNRRRLITGILGGYGLLTLYYYIIKGILHFFKM